VRAIVDRVIPSIVGVGAIADLDGELDPEVLRREHVRATVRMLQDYSISLATAAAEGRCAIVGVEYTLADGTVSVVETVGSIG
jgi:carbonic anhydrase